MPHSLPLLPLLLEGVAVARLNRQALVHLASGGGSEASSTYRTSPICSVSLSPGSSGMGWGGGEDDEDTDAEQPYGGCNNNHVPAVSYRNDGSMARGKI